MPSACGRIFYDAFASIAARHNLPIEPGSPEFTRFKVGELLAHDGVAGLVAERDGDVLGSAFVDERAAIAGDRPGDGRPGAQDDGVGRALMQAVLERERARGAAGIRLVQTAYHYRSLALYAKLGFVVREPLSVLQGAPPALSLPGLGVRPARVEDVAACGELCARVHGHDRNGELRDAIAAGTAAVVERPGRHLRLRDGVRLRLARRRRDQRDLIALLGSAEAFIGPRDPRAVAQRRAPPLVPRHGLRIVQQSTLMTIGLYNEPVGAYLPSILF